MSHVSIQCLGAGQHQHYRTQHDESLQGMLLHECESIIRIDRYQDFRRFDDVVDT